jgi:anthranilate phosphoribosyltransferase
LYVESRFENRKMGVKMEENLRYFGSKVDALIRGQNLTRAEAGDLFRQILKNEQPDLQQGAFLAAITSKGATPQEIAGIWEAIYEIDTVKVRPDVSGPLVENCGTGMDSIKTFNISTAASIVAAADGIIMAKHGARAITSKCGAVDILETLGVDVECDVSLVKRSIEEAGIGIFNGMSGKVHPQALYRILSQIRFGTVLNIAGSLANPALPSYGVRGVYSKEMVLPIAKAMREIGYKRALVMHGRSADDARGMDELSTLGPSVVAELTEDGEIHEFTVVSEELGVKKGDEASILYQSDRTAEAISLLRVLSGNDASHRREIVCLNAAPLLYITGHAASLKEGVDKAREILDSDKPVKLLKAWVKQQNASPAERLEMLEELIAKASA